MTARFKLAAACGLCFATAAQAAPDARLLSAAEKAQPAVIESLKEMVLIESGSADKAGLAKMAELVARRLEALGFATERRKSGDSAEAVVGTLHGTGKAKVMLQGHMDTVYPSGILATQPYKVEGNRVYGPGIADDKGGIAVILHSLQILLDTGWRDFATLTVLVDPDEEVGSGSAAALISQLADEHDVVLSFEPAAAKSVIKGEPLLLGAAGIAKAALEVKGRTAHAGAAPEQGRNAVIELAHQLLQTRDVAKDIPGAQLNWTNVRSDKASNQIPDLATAVGDVRITQPGADDKLFAALKTKIESSHLVPDTQTSVRLDVNRPAFLAGERGRALAEKAKAIYAEMGRELAFVPMSGGGTDAAFAARSGKATVLESFGLAGWGYHAKDEYIEADSIVPRLYLVTRLLTELGKQ
jgi:glutamate carboxypeptidase